MELKVQLKLKKEWRLMGDVLFVILPTLRTLLCNFLSYKSEKVFFVLFLCKLEFGFSPTRRGKMTYGHRDTKARKTSQCQSQLLHIGPGHLFALLKDTRTLCIPQQQHTVATVLH